MAFTDSKWSRSPRPCRLSKRLELPIDGLAFGLRQRFYNSPIYRLPKPLWIPQKTGEKVGQQALQRVRWSAIFARREYRQKQYGPSVIRRCPVRSCSEADGKYRSPLSDRSGKAQGGEGAAIVKKPESAAAADIISGDVVAGNATSKSFMGSGTVQCPVTRLTSLASTSFYLCPSSSDSFLPAF